MRANSLVILVSSRLPNLVLFPHVVQPFHIFEERYREMIEDALADDGLLTLTSLKPGWEPDYDSRPAIEPYGCLARIITNHQLEDGCYNILLFGLRRVRIVRELSPLRAFRLAQVELITETEAKGERPTRDSDVVSSSGGTTPPVSKPTSIESARAEKLRQQLLDCFRLHMPRCKDGLDTFAQLLDRELPLGPLTDLICYTLPLRSRFKLRLLAEADSYRRAIALIKAMRKQSERLALLKSSSQPTDDPQGTAGQASVYDPFSVN